MDKNYSDDVALARNTFLFSEYEFLKELVEIPLFLDLYKEYKELNVTELSKKLMDLTEKMENGQVKEEDEGKVELEIMCCALAIEEAVKEKGPISKMMERGKSR